MDDERSPRLAFSPDLRLTGLAAGGAGLALFLAVTADAAGRVLFAVAAVVLAGYAATDLVLRPRLIANAAGLRVRAPFARAELSWAQIEAIRADERTRFGLRSVALEIDAGPTLIVLTRRALGADPADVAGLLRSFTT